MGGEMVMKTISQSELVKNIAEYCEPLGRAEKYTGEHLNELDEWNAIDILFNYDNTLSSVDSLIITIRSGLLSDEILDEFSLYCAHRAKEIVQKMVGWDQDPLVMLAIEALEFKDKQIMGEVSEVEFEEVYKKFKAEAIRKSTITEPNGFFILTVDYALSHDAEIAAKYEQKEVLSIMYGMLDRDTMASCGIECAVTEEICDEQILKLVEIIRSHE